MKDPDANNIIVENYLANFQANTSNKFSSNVYEKCLENCDFETRQKIIKNLCSYNGIKSLLYDMYGNYVLQQTMEKANEPYRTKYIQTVASLFDGL